MKPILKPGTKVKIKSKGNARDGEGGTIVKVKGVGVLMYQVLFSDCKKEFFYEKDVLTEDFRSTSEVN